MAGKGTKGVEKLYTYYGWMDWLIIADNTKLEKSTERTANVAEIACPLVYTFGSITHKMLGRNSIMCKLPTLHGFSIFHTRIVHTDLRWRKPHKLLSEGGLPTMLNFNILNHFWQEYAFDPLCMFMCVHFVLYVYFGQKWRKRDLLERILKILRSWDSLLL